jgi:choline dehydrogenase-like flavoprotein
MSSEHDLLSSSTRQILLDLAVTAMPAGPTLAAPSWETIDRIENFLEIYPRFRRGIEALAWTFDQAARLRFGRSFRALSPESRLAYLEALFDGTYAERQLLRLLLTPLKVARFDDPELFAAARATYRLPPVVESPPRYLERAIDAATLPPDETIEADVVVVGSGAGGAVVAAELAQLGVATVIVEEGRYFRRPDFSGRALEMISTMYRDQGVTFTFGNCSIAVPMGCCVGGTTTINSGTCYRAPDRVLRRWRDELGLHELSPEAMDPHFAKVEQVLRVTRAEPRHVGAIGEVMARGCAALGYTRYGPLPRNAPDCDASSLCCFGCPTDAKRSTNVSYVPLALRSGAQLLYRARVERVLLESGRAVGVEAASPSGRVTVRARAVVIAAGTLMTAALLLRQRLATGSGQVGRNLSLHPALGVIGVFPDEIRGYRCIPQGYGVEEFDEEGLMIEGAFVPLDFGSGGVTLFGPRFTELMESYAHIGYLGFLIEDTSRGRVRLGPGGRPVMTYVMNDHDVALLKRGVEILSRIYHAAGSTAVFPMVRGFTELPDAHELARFRRTRLRARDFELTAHHPLGTARMGVDRRSSVVGPTHEAHDVPRLFICDGSAVPTSLGVNPQVTIMALATRAAAFVARAAEAS